MAHGVIWGHPLQGTSTLPEMFESMFIIIYWNIQTVLQN